MRRCATLAKFNFTHFQRNIPGDVGGIHGFVGKAFKALIYLYFHVEIFVFVFGNICISKYMYLCLEMFVTGNICICAAWSTGKPFAHLSFECCQTEGPENDFNMTYLEKYNRNHWFKWLKCIYLVNYQ